MQQAYPVRNPEWADEAAEHEMTWLMNVLLSIRRIRGEMNIAPGKPLPVLLEQGSQDDRAFLENGRDYIHKLGRVESVRWLDVGEIAPESAIALVGEMKLLIPMRGLIDKEAELARLNREIERISKELPRLEGKLSDAAFLAKAPPSVVEKEKARLQELHASVAELKSQMHKISQL